METRNTFAGFIFLLSLTCVYPCIAQDTNVGLFFYTTSYQFGEDTEFLEFQSNSIKDDLMYSYGFRTSTYANYTRQNLANSIENECLSDSSKQLFIYIAGKSVIKDDEGYLVLHDSDSLSFQDMFPLNEFVNLLANCNSKHILLFTDVPHSGLKTINEELLKPSLTIDTVSTREDIITRSFSKMSKINISNTGDSLNPGKHYTKMSGKLLEALRNYGGTDGVITIAELNDYLQNVEPAPSLGTIKGHESGGDFLFIAK
jgi:hypothetical protein